MTSDIQVTVSKWMVINEIRIYFVRNLCSVQERKECGSTFAVRPHVWIRETLDKTKYTVRRNSKFV